MRDLCRPMALATGVNNLSESMPLVTWSYERLSSCQRRKMNLKITIRLNNMRDDTDVCVVNYILKQQIMEHLDLEQHPQDMRIHVQEIEE